MEIKRTVEKILFYTGGDLIRNQFRKEHERAQSTGDSLNLLLETGLKNAAKTYYERLKLTHAYPIVVFRRVFGFERPEKKPKSS